MFFKGLVDGTVFLKWIWTGFSSDFGRFGSFQ